MDNATISIERNLQEGRIQKLSTLAAEIRRQTAEPSSFPSHKDTLRSLFGQVVGLCWESPEATARYIWRLNEGKGGLDAKES